MFIFKMVQLLKTFILFKKNRLKMFIVLKGPNLKNLQIYRKCSFLKKYSDLKVQIFEKK